MHVNQQICNHPPSWSRWNIPQVRYLHKSFAYWGYEIDMHWNVILGIDPSIPYNFWGKSDLQGLIRRKMKGPNASFTYPNKSVIICDHVFLATCWWILMLIFFWFSSVWECPMPLHETHTAGWYDLSGANELTLLNSAHKSWRNSSCAHQIHWNLLC